MSWIERPLEKAMRKALEGKLGDVDGSTFYNQYSSLRDRIISDNFFTEIKGIEKDLTDHSQRHIANVLDNAYKLLGENPEKYLTAFDIYCLGLIILFHDVGNIRGRKDHNNAEKIAEVYSFYRKESGYRQEKQIVTKVASTHSGKNSLGTGDTLDELDATSSLQGETIMIRDLAAILRFADELAEGKQRTSSFMIEKDLYDKKSEIFHKYAECTEIHIDKNNERIAITFNINIEKNTFDKSKLRELIEFSYERVLKLDLERRYCKNYSKVLNDFRFITVQYNFTIDELPVKIELDQIRLKDRYPIPGNENFTGDVQKYIISTHENFIVDNLINAIELNFKTVEDGI